MSKEDAIVLYFCTHISQRVFAPTRISLLKFPSLSFSQFVTIRDSIDVHYYLFNGEKVPHQVELVQLVERSLSRQEVLGSMHRFSSH